MKKLVLALAVLGVLLWGSEVFAEGIDDYTKLILHCNGADGSQSFVDDSLYHHPVTAYGNAQIDTAEFKFGDASALFDGNGDYLTIPDSDDWNFGTDDFTIDLWVNINSADSWQRLVTQYVDDINYWFLTATWLAPNRGVAFYAISGGVNKAVYYSYDNLLPPGWHHVAAVRFGTNFDIFVDGVSVNLSVVTEIGSNALPDLATPLRIGVHSSEEYFNGWQDEVRISKGIARWTSDFTPPTAEYSLPPNELPIANAGQDMVVATNEVYQLNGSGSYDPNGTIVSYTWKLMPYGPGTGQLTTPYYNAKQTGNVEDIIQLTVTDDRGATATDTVKITNQRFYDLENKAQGSEGRFSALENLVNQLKALIAQLIPGNKKPVSE
jgi:hypothetical protein